LLGALTLPALLHQIAAEPARAVGAIVLVFVLPGFLLLRFLAPQRKLDFELSLLSVAMSVALLPPLALVLNRFKALSPSGWGVGLALLCLAAWAFRRRDLPGAPFEKAEELRRPVVIATLRLLRPGRVIRLSVVVLMITMAVGTARYGALNQRQFAYTEFWMLPSEKGDYRRLKIGVRNEEKRLVNYDLEISLNSRVFERRHLIVRNGDTWLNETTAPNDQSEEEQVIQAKLYRSDDPSMLYRQALLRFSPGSKRDHTLGSAS
jgi:uncharacterized membrane protein